LAADFLRIENCSCLPFSSTREEETTEVSLLAEHDVWRRVPNDEGPVAVYSEVAGRKAGGCAPSDLDSREGSASKQSFKTTKRCLGSRCCSESGPKRREKPSSGCFPALFGPGRSNQFPSFASCAAAPLDCVDKFKRKSTVLSTALLLKSNTAGGFRLSAPASASPRCAW
jgi:hypothetical protein